MLQSVSDGAYLIVVEVQFLQQRELRKYVGIKIGDRVLPQTEFPQMGSKSRQIETAERAYAQVQQLEFLMTRKTRPA